MSNVEDELINIVFIHSKMRDAYVWGRVMHPAHRDIAISEANTDIKFCFDGILVNVVQTCTYYNKQVYYKLYVYVNGVRKDVRFLKKLLLDKCRGVTNYEKK